MSDSYEKLKKAYIEAVVEGLNEDENEEQKALFPADMVGSDKYKAMSDEEKLAVDRKFYQDQEGMEVDHDMLKDQKIKDIIEKAKDIIENYEDGFRTAGETFSRLVDLGQEALDAWKEVQNYEPRVLDK